MKVNSCQVQNFASYKDLEFNFTDQGLCLIQGPTGAGKSTLMDIIPWCLFGITSKNGPVTDVISWPGTEITKVTLWLDNVTIRRSRGPKAKDNDLMFIPTDGIVTRGKDLLDTQKLINQFLGLDAELYCAGSYFNEFSPTSQFFTTSAKNRRTLCEQLVDLSLAKRLSPKLKDELGEVEDEMIKLETRVNKNQSNIEMLERLQLTENNKAKSWNIQHENTRQYVMLNYEKFEKNRKKIMDKTCHTCGTVLEEPYEVTDLSENPHKQRLEELETTMNPHLNSVKDYTEEINLKKLLIERDELMRKDLTDKISEFTQLQDIVNDYRSISITNTIQGLETQTNKLLEKHFDGEIKVNFQVEDADKLDVTIHKDGNVCSFSQLSKGQRQILKLTFGVSVMNSIQNHHGITFSQIWIDEGLDGFSEELKIKALKLFEELALQYESVFMVDHSEGVKAAVNNRYQVELINGESHICQV